MKQRNFWSKIRLGSAAILLLAAGCRNAGRTAQAQERVVPVTISVATTADVPLYVDCLGVCVAHDTVDVVPRISGEILQIHFSPGQMVEAGQLLYSIDPRVCEANVTLARGQLQAAKAKLELDRSRLARSTELAGSHYIAPYEFDALKATVAQSEGQVQVALVNLQQAEIYLDFCSIRSPIKGLTGYNRCSGGNVVTAGGAPLVTVQRLDPMYVDFSISENEFPQVYGYFKQQRQLSCEVSPIAHPQVKAMAQLELVDNQVLKQSGNVKLRAIFSNENFTFWAGESARIRLILTTMKNAVLAPDVAVNTNQAGHFIFVVNGESRAEVRPVVLGQAHGTDVVVREGLKKGDRVIVAGQFLLAPQTHVVVAGELIPSAPAADKATDRTSAKPSADHRSVNSQDEQKKSQTANGSPLPALSNEKNFRAADKNSPGQITRALPGDEQR